MLTPFRTLIIFVVLMITGVSLLPFLVVDLQPIPEQNVVTVQYSLTQSSPEVVEDQVTAVLENVFSQLTEVENMRSVSHYNMGNIQITFNKYAKKETKKIELAGLIRQIYPSLPKNCSYPTILDYAKKSQKNAMPLLVYSLISENKDAYQIKKHIEQTLKPYFASLSQLKEINITGAEEKEICIKYDLKKMEFYQISKNDLLENIQHFSQEKYIGIFKNEIKQQFFIKTKNYIQDFNVLENIFIKPNVRFKDIAHISLENQETNYALRINGLASVRVAFYAKENSNQIQLAKEIIEKIKNYQNLYLKKENNKKNKDDIKIIQDYNHIAQLEHELQKIYFRSGISVLILALFVLLAYQNWRYLMVLFLAMLANLSLTSIGVFVLGVHINLYTLAGLTLSLGMIVDNMTILLHHYQKQKNIKIILVLLTTTLLTISTLLLVFLLPKEDILYLGDFAKIISLNIFFSLPVALWVIPALYKVFFKPYPKPLSKGRGALNSRKKFISYFFYQKCIYFLQKRKALFYTFLILLFGLPVFLLPDKIQDFELYNATIGSELYQEKIRPYTDKFLGGSLRIFVNEVYEKSGYRQPEQNKLYVNAQMPFGATFEYTDQIAQHIENYLKNIQGIDKFVTNIQEDNYFSIQITFTPQEENGDLPYRLKSQLIAKSLEQSGIMWEIYGVGQGFSNQQGENLANFRVEMRGYNFLELEKQATILAKKLEKHERIQTVNIHEKMSYNEKSVPQYKLYLDNKNLQKTGISTGQFYENLYNKSKNNQIDGFLFYQNLLTPFRLIEQNSLQFSAYQTQNEISVLSAQKSFLPKKYATLKLENTQASLYKENRQYIRMLGYEYFGNTNFGEKFLHKTLDEMQQEMPAGYSTKYIAFSFGQEKQRRKYELLASLLVWVLVVCSIFFEDFKMAFWVVLQIPLSFIGLFLAFGLGQFYFDQGGYASFVLLASTSTNISVLILYYLKFSKNFIPEKINQGNKNENTKKNVKLTSKNNLFKPNITKILYLNATPIFISIFSTILGLIPFLSEGENEAFWFSLAIGSIGGLLFSIFNVFVVLPVVAFVKK